MRSSPGVYNNIFFLQNKLATHWRGENLWILFLPDTCARLWSRIVMKWRMTNVECLCVFPLDVIMWKCNEVLIPTSWYHRLLEQAVNHRIKAVWSLSIFFVDFLTSKHLFFFDEEEFEECLTCARVARHLTRIWQYSSSDWHEYFSLLYFLRSQKNSLKMFPNKKRVYLGLFAKIGWTWKFYCYSCSHSHDDDGVDLTPGQGQLRSHDDQLSSEFRIIWNSLNIHAHMFLVLAPKSNLKITFQLIGIGTLRFFFTLDCQHKNKFCLFLSRWPLPRSAMYPFDWRSYSISGNEIRNKIQFLVSCSSIMTESL